MAKPISPRGVNYTIPGLFAIVGIVLVTALFFAQDGTIPQQAGGFGGDNLAGAAYGPNVDVSAATSCEQQSRCEGSKLVRQSADCRQYVAFCKYGCAESRAGAVCR